MESSSQNSLQNFYRNSLEELKEIEEVISGWVTQAREFENLWENIYDRVFSERVSKRVFQICKEMGSRFEYYDPDTSYEEDVLAFYYALKEKVTQFERLNV